MERLVLGKPRPEPISVKVYAAQDCSQDSRCDDAGYLHRHASGHLVHLSGSRAGHVEPASFLVHERIQGRGDTKSLPVVSN